MKTLYRAANALEAHMLLDLLRQQGLTAHIQGEHLQGAIGELPASGLVRLVVDEADYDRARAVVERWEANQPKDERPTTATRASRVWIGVLVGIALGVAGSYAYFRSPVSVDGIDYNRDGLLDEKWTYAPSGRMLKYESDRNLDGKVDYVAHYDARGLIESAEADDNFDGVFETRMRFRNGNVEVSDIDTDGDGYVDLRTHYDSGVPSYSEFINPATGLPLRVEHYRLGRLIAAEVDTDLDGVLDTRYTYGKLNDVLTTEKIPAR